MPRPYLLEVPDTARRAPTDGFLMCLLLTVNVLRVTQFADLLLTVKLARVVCQSCYVRCCSVVGFTPNRLPLERLDVELYGCSALACSSPSHMDFRLSPAIQHENCARG